jgi:hypothetical protein
MISLQRIRHRFGVFFVEFHLYLKGLLDQLLVCCGLPLA